MEPEQVESPPLEVVELTDLEIVIAPPEPEPEPEAPARKRAASRQRRTRSARADSEGAVGESPDADDSAFDASTVEPVTPRATPKLKPEPKGPKAGPPSMDEWQDFFGRIVLRTLTDGYVHLILRDIELSDRELESIKLSREELNDMAAPFSSLANKSKLMRRHGRNIIAATDSYEAIICMAMWARRVNRIAKRHAKVQGPAPTLITTEGIVIPDEQPHTAPAGEGSSPESPADPDGQPGYFRVHNPGGG